MINGIYWDNEVFVFFIKEDMQVLDFNIQVIVDVICDIVLVFFIFLILWLSIILEFVFGFDLFIGIEMFFYQFDVVDMMMIDNLFNELFWDVFKVFG